MVLEERRLHPRAKLEHLAYIRLQSGNGGIVLNVSEGGLSFHTAVPLEGGKSIHFRFPVKPGDEIDVTGELTWSDQTRKSGGLRFIEIPNKFHEQIRIWLGQPQLSTQSVEAPGPAAETPVAAVGVPNPTPSKMSDPVLPSKTSSSVQTYCAADPPLVKRAKIGWRSAVFVSLILVTLGLSCAIILFVRRSIQNYIQQEVASDARNSLLAAQGALSQNEVVLRRKADLLATFVATSPTNDPTFQDSIDNPLVSDGSDFIVLTDGGNQIIALQTRNPSMTISVAQKFILRSVQKRDPSDWWYYDGSLYQVATQTVDRRQLGQNRSGVVTVGRRIADGVFEGVPAMTGGHVAIICDGEVIASTLSLFDRHELVQKFHERLNSEQIEIGQEQFYSSSLFLPNSSGMVIRLTALKSLKEGTAFLTGLDHLFVRLSESALLVLFGLTILFMTLSRHRVRLSTYTFRRWLSTGLLYSSRWTRDEVVHMTRAFDRRLTARYNASKTK